MRLKFVIYHWNHLYFPLFSEKKKNLYTCLQVNGKRGATVVHISYLFKFNDSSWTVWRGAEHISIFSSLFYGLEIEIFWDFYRNYAYSSNICFSCASYGSERYLKQNLSFFQQSLHIEKYHKVMFHAIMNNNASWS